MFPPALRIWNLFGLDTHIKEKKRMVGWYEKGVAGTNAERDPEYHRNHAVSPADVSLESEHNDMINGP